MFLVSLTGFFALAGGTLVYLRYKRGFYAFLLVLFATLIFTFLNAEIGLVSKDPLGATVIFLLALFAFIGAALGGGLVSLFRWFKLRAEQT